MEEHVDLTIKKHQTQQVDKTWLQISRFICICVIDIELLRKKRMEHASRMIQASKFENNLK
jgi:hypothetical protein